MYSGRTSYARISRVWRLLLAMAALAFSVQVLLVAWQLTCTAGEAGVSPASGSELRHQPNVRIQIVQHDTIVLQENPNAGTQTAAGLQRIQPLDQHPLPNVPSQFTVRPTSPLMAERLKQLGLPTGEEVVSDPSIKMWLDGRMKLCGGAFEGYANEFAVLHDVIVDPSLAAAKRVGGEPISKVLNQVERDEYFTLTYGFFRLNGVCREADAVGIKRTLHYSFNKKNHLRDYLAVLDPGLSATPHPPEVVTTWSRTAVMLTRNDFANLFQTTAEWYNVFLMTLLFQLHPDDIDIILLDAHPESILDTPWRTLWPHIYRFGDRSVFGGSVRFTNLIWLQQGFSSPLNTYAWRRFPFIENFRHFLLSRHNVSSETPARSSSTACLFDEVPLRGTSACAEKPAHCATPTVLLLLRKDYVSHPRNPTGHISRKLSNEEAVMEALRAAAPGARVERFVPTEMSMREQMVRVARADVLLGIHGAGHTLGLFLPKHGALVEFVPSFYRMRNSHFAMIARERGLVHQMWAQEDRTLDDVLEQTSKLPPQEVSDTLAHVLRRMCLPLQRQIMLTPSSQFILERQSQLQNSFQITGRPL